MAPDPSSQALVVGVSQYQHVADLPPTQDVQGMRDVLASPDHCAYPPERVTVLEQEQATRDSILAALKRLCAQASSPSARTFFYFSGHGGQDASGSSYIIPVDARKGQYPTTAISASELSQLLDRCAGEVTVVLDCCYAAGMARRTDASGAGSSDKPGLDLVRFGEAFRKEIQSRQRVVFAACLPDNLAYGSRDAPYGIFTGHILDGLRGKASTDGYDVNVYQLFDYVQKHVASSSDDMQQPSFIASIKQFYPLTRYPQRIPLSEVFEKDVYIGYDREDPILRKWVEKTFQPDLERNGCSIWNYDDLGNIRLDSVHEAIKKSKYVVVLLTRSYLRNQQEEFNATMAILQAIHTRTPRFIPIKRERFELPYTIEAFVGLDMSDWNQMEFRHSMERLIKRLKKAPHER